MKISFVLFSSLLLLVSFMPGQQSPQGLKVGDKAPALVTTDSKGNTVSLEKMLSKGPVVIFFYRGQWCPYCNKQMSELQDSLSFLMAKGATVLAVTPETEVNIKKTISKTHASFSIVHDKDSRIMKEYKANFSLDSATMITYKKYGIDLETANGNKENTLPVPATYLINKQGIITYAHFDPDYKKRASVKDILQALDKI